MRSSAGLREALDQPDLNWTVGGDLVWTEAAVPDAEGAAAGQWQVPYVGYGFLEHEGWLETGVQGPAVFSFSARMNKNPYLNFTVLVDDAPVTLLRKLDGSSQGQTAWMPWKTLSCFVPEGTHRVRFHACLGCVNGGTLRMNMPACQVDAVTVRGADAAVAVALDAPEIAWFSAGAPRPGIVTGAAASHDGVDAVVITDQLSETWLQGRLAGSVTLEWWQRGHGPFSVNGQALAGGTDLWSERKVFIPPGSAVVQWDFGAAPSTAARSMTLDEIRAIPSAPLAAELALSTEASPAGVVLSSGWSGAATAAAPDGQDLAWVTPLPGFLETMRIPVSGAGILHLTMAFRNSPQTNWQVDGRPIAFDGRSAGGGFYDYRFFIPPGAQWFYLSVQAGVQASSTVLVDALRFVPATPVTPAAALDEPGVEFSTHPDRPWPALEWGNALDGRDSCPSADSMDGETFLDAAFTGPGTLRFEWTSTFLSTYDFPVKVLLNGRPMPLHVDKYEFDGRQFSGSAAVETGPGAHHVRWLVPAGRPFGFFTLDKVEWAPHAVHSGGAVLTATDGWMASGLPWVADEDISPAGNGPSLRFGPVTGLAVTTSNYANTGPVLQIPITGPAIARFVAMTENGSLVVAARGQSSRVIRTTTAPWTLVEVLVPPGPMALDLLPSGAGVFSADATTIWITDFAITGIERPLGEAVSAPGLTWNTSPENPWAGIPGEALAGLPLAASPSWLETTVFGPCLVDWQTSGAAAFTVNGRTIAQPYVSDSSGYRPSGIFLPAGLHTLRWTDAGAYLGRLKAVTVSPMSGLPSISRTGDKLRFFCPRPAGVMDSQLMPQVAYDLSSVFYTMFQDYSIAESTPDHLLMEIPVPPGQKRMFLRLLFQR